MDHLSKNIISLRTRRNLTQAEIASLLGFKRTTWNNYESGVSSPSLEGVFKIAKYFDINVEDFVLKDLSNVNLIAKNKEDKKYEKVNLNVNATVNPNAKKEHNRQELKISFVAEPGTDYDKVTPIPIADISVAAGISGIYNNEYVEHLDSIKLPVNLTKRNATYLAVKIKGHSMSPTLQDGGYVIIRLLDRSEWPKMHEERIYVISDMDGKTFLKRVKNRFKQDFIVLMSDNPDKASFPNFNLATNEIHTIWYVEWYLSAKMPNIHDQFYPRLQRLEEKVDLLLKNNPKM